MSQKNNLSVPGISKSIVRPVVRTTTAVVKRGEALTKGVVGTIKHALTGTAKVATTFVKDTSKTVRKTVVGKQTRKSRKSSRK